MPSTFFTPTTRTDEIRRFQPTHKECGQNLARSPARLEGMSEMRGDFVGQRWLGGPSWAEPGWGSNPERVGKERSQEVMRV